MADLHLANRVRLYPTPLQAQLLEKTFGCTRWIFNYYLEQRIQDYARYKKHLRCGKDKSHFKWRVPETEANLKHSHDWLREVDSTALQQAHNDLNTAFKNYHQHGRGKPKFKAKGKDDSFRCQMGLAVDLEKSQIKVGKNGWLKCRGLRPIEGRVKNITVSKEAGRLYASIVYEVGSNEFYEPKKFKYKALGIDLGVVRPLTITNGSAFQVLGREERQHLKVLASRRKRYQRVLSRKRKGSNNQVKAKAKVARAFQKERQYRHNFQHQVSHKLTKNAKTLVFEDLKLVNMTKKGKGKHGLNREMLRLGLSSIIRLCQYKAQRRGGTVTFVDPRYTSQTCSDCGTVDKKSRESQSRFRCVACGFKINADRNAALNILARAA